MPNPTYVLISSVTVGAGGAASIDFSSIPATYTDLKLVYSCRGSSSGLVYDTANATVNGSTANFSVKFIEGNGSSASTFSATRNWGNAVGSTATANTFSNNEVYIPNYLSSSNKSYSIDSAIETNGTTTYLDMGAGLWSNTSAITSISIAASSGTFVQYSTAYLYGISNS